ncbi:PQQ-binding-like beta-propeller repeat protein [Marinibacterium sp. SX1]|uniref:PQQ-like beta-propeller repeat protein n=1 Tax=Marinibacterium sp. SX1 TaxID=3388424 RepID=UPI003D1631F0
MNKAIENTTGRGRILLPALAIAVALAGCSEPEVVLPGDREDIAEVTAFGKDPDPDANRSVAISLPAQVSNASWAQGPGTPAHRTTNAALRPVPVMAWATDIGEGDDRKHRITAAPVVGGGRIYTLDSRDQVTAVAPNGAVLWSVDARPAYAGKDDATGGGLAYDDGTLYVSLGFGDLVALDAATGGTRWVQELDATGSGKPMVVGDLVYVVAGDDTGWAVERSNGRIRWQLSVTESIANVLGAPAPALADDLVVFAFGSGDIVGAFRQGGLRRWNSTVAGQRPGRSAARIGDVTGAPMVVGNTVYVGNASGRIAALDASTGERRWTAPFGAITQVWPAGGSLFALTDSNQLVRMDASDGAPIWSVDLPKYIKDKPLKRGPVYAHYGPILAGSRIWIASNDGFLRAFSPTDGSLLAEIEVPGGATTDPVVAGNTLYVVSTRGQLFAFR